MIARVSGSRSAGSCAAYGFPATAAFEATGLLEAIYLPADPKAEVLAAVVL